MQNIVLSYSLEQYIILLWQETFSGRVKSLNKLATNTQEFCSASEMAYKMIIQMKPLTHIHNIFHLKSHVKFS